MSLRDIPLKDDPNDKRKRRLSSFVPELDGLTANQRALFAIQNISTREQKLAVMIATIFDILKDEGIDISILDFYAMPGEETDVKKIQAMVKKLLTRKPISVKS